MAKPSIQYWQKFPYSFYTFFHRDRFGGSALDDAVRHGHTQVQVAGKWILTDFSEVQNWYFLNF